MTEDLIRKIVEQIVDTYEQSSSTSLERHVGGSSSSAVPVEVSARHVHLCQSDVDMLFGQGYTLKKKKDISQPGQYICEERVTLIGPKGQIANVAVLGPLREHTQIEISLTDSRALGIAAPVNMSGNLTGAAALYLMNGSQMILAERSVIAARNHIHMTREDARRLGVNDGQCVSVSMETGRPLIFSNVAVRVDEQAKLAFHIDTDEANACSYQTGDRARIQKIESLTMREAYKQREPCETESLHFDGRLFTEQHVLELPQGTTKMTVKKTTIITPMAKDALRQRKIALKFV